MAGMLCVNVTAFATMLLRSQPRLVEQVTLLAGCLLVRDWFARVVCLLVRKQAQADRRTDGLYQVLGGTVLRWRRLALFHRNTDQDTQKISMSEAQQHTVPAPAARREKPKYRGGAGADHVRPTNAPAPVRIVFLFCSHCGGDS